MDQAVFDELQQAAAANGPAAAIDLLCTRLRERKDYNSLFYALALKKRHELGVLPVPTAPSNDLPEGARDALEEALRAAARHVGRLYLDEGNIPQAWVYYRMLGEPGPVAEALERHKPEPEEDVQQLVQIAFYEGVLPRKGFDWVLQHFGLCSAITNLGGHELPHSLEVKQYCVGRLVRALHQELGERLRGEVLRREGAAPETESGPGSVRRLLAGRDWLFEDDFYHIDVSHLSSVVQMSVHLPRGEELELARELCEYGKRLSPRVQYGSEPPFEDHYRDYGVYLATLAGDGVEEGVAHFRAKCEAADPEEVGTYPAEVFVNLLLRLDRPAEALAAFRRYLSAAANRQLTCPGITELCQRANDYGALAEVARQQGDAVHFVAGLLAAK